MWKIKLLGLVVLLIGVSGCERKFPSMTQASEGCEKWVRQGKKMNYLGYEKGYQPLIRKKVPVIGEARYCKAEEETNQILGYENPAIVDGTWKSEDGWKGSEVVKHFRY